MFIPLILNAWCFYTGHIYFRMNITPEIESTIDELVERWVPSGTDKYFHIEPRSYMKEMIMKLLINNTIPPKLSYITAILKNWKPFLAKRFGALN